MLNFKLTSDAAWQMSILFMLTVAVILAPELASADGYSTTDDGISNVLCLIVTKLTGPIGKTIGIIALVVLGISVFMGKVSWTLALSTALGITFIFSAGKIINWLSSTGTDNCVNAVK